MGKRKKIEQSLKVLWEMVSKTIKETGCEPETAECVDIVCEVCGSPCILVTWEKGTAGLSPCVCGYESVKKVRSKMFPEHTEAGTLKVPFEILRN